MIQSRHSAQPHRQKVQEKLQWLSEMGFEQAVSGISLLGWTPERVPSCCGLWFAEAVAQAFNWDSVC